MSDIAAVHDEIEQLNREREEFVEAQKAKAMELARKRDAMYIEACAKRDSIRKAGIYKGEVVYVFDPELLDADTLEILAHMGTPVPPVNEVYPDGVTIPE